MKKFLPVLCRMTCVIVAAVCGYASMPKAVAADVTLIPIGSSWRYLDDGSDQGVAWRGTEFVDTAWAEGPAKLGYGNRDEATVVAFIDTDPETPDAQKNATTYFRTTFTTSDPSPFTSLILTLTYDDGGVVYLNGTEVARTANLPVDPAYDSFTSGSSGENATQSWTVAPELLSKGVNTLAVEIHQSNSKSSDIAFDLELVGTDTISVTRGPYLQVGTSSSVVVRWRTNTPTDSRVVYGISPETLTQSAANPERTTEHEITVAGLSPDTRYYYGVGNATGIFEGENDETFFVTSPVPGAEKPTRIWVLGDSGSANSNQKNVRDAYYRFTGAAHTDLWLMLGDNAYNTGKDEEYQVAVFDIYGAMLRKSVLWPTLGNHDAGALASNGVNPYFNLFTLPVAGEAGGEASHTESYYSFDYANIHFICLDSQSSNRSKEGAMHRWLENDLSQTSQKWVIAFWHHPPYSKGSHNSDTEVALVEMRENFLPLLEAHGVDLVLAGHSHSYERSMLIDGFYATPTLATSGTFKNSGNGNPAGDGSYAKDAGPHNGAVYAVAGSSGRISGGPLNHPVMITSLNVLGSMVLDVSGNRLDATFLDDQGDARDNFTIIKSPPPNDTREGAADQPADSPR